ncbi:MAG TPA: ABC transporter ATP-binding protein [Gaiellaceae bacterium]|jgi:oligopeptide/dipeptide ABC transporter ATP-binding protein
MTQPLLTVEGLKVQFATEDGIVRAVDGVDFALERGRVLGIVGESGSGKSVTSMTLLGLTRGANALFEGRAMFDGLELIGASESQLRRVRGAGIAMIFQDPMTSLNPVQRVGDQIIEMIRAHEPVDEKEARRRTIELFGEVGIANPSERVDSYPHEFSGGMRQRVMIAMALACSPDVLIADEPTTALDVTIQAQILELIAKLKDEHGTSVILITHDLGVVARLADDIAVMYAGRIVEQGPKEEIFYDPQHPYTWGLLGSIPRIDRPKPPKLHAIPGQPPSLLRPPQGCRFRPRCPHAFDKCFEEPQLESRIESPTHLDRCWLTPEQKRGNRGETIQGTTGEEAA